MRGLHGGFLSSQQSRQVWKGRQTSAKLPLRSGGFKRLLFSRWRLWGGCGGPVALQRRPESSSPGSSQTWGCGQAPCVREQAALPDWSPSSVHLLGLGFSFSSFYFFLSCLYLLERILSSNTFNFLPLSPRTRSLFSLVSA